MSSLFEDIKSFSSKDKLKNVPTVVTRSDGQRFTESKTASGELHTIAHTDKGLGFCPDLRPDITVGTVLSGIFVASQDIAHDKLALTKFGITHILNVAASLRNAFPSDYIYCNVAMYDDEEEVLMKHYSQCQQFIDNALANKGTVLIHCRAGRSRSVSIAIAYMMNKNNSLTVEQCMETIRETRPQAEPNKGFMKQLNILQEEIRK